MVVGPIDLLQHVVDDVETTGLEEPQGFVEVAELANPGIREDEIELRRRQPADEDCGVLEVERHPLIARQVPSGDVHHGGVVVHGDEAGIGRHPGEQP